MSSDPAATIAASERWFRAHGMPYFVEAERLAVREGLRPRRLAPLALIAMAVGVAIALAFVYALDDAVNATMAGLVSAGVVLAAYAATALRVGPIASWAVGHTLGSLGLLFPLVTRALPLLLLFVTFLFINTEVWMVASSLRGGVLWGAVLLFAGVAVGFLLVRLPEELDDIDDEVHGRRLVESCRGTPVEAVCDQLVDGDDDLFDLGAAADVAGLQKWNLVLVALVSQIAQVLLLSVAVFMFFIVFGTVVMRQAVVESWLGREPRQLVPGVDGLTIELAQVSLFLAAFSGLYFTVYAVTDETYRGQFFRSVTRELERGVGVRAIYLALQQSPDARGRHTD